MTNPAYLNLADGYFPVSRMGIPGTIPFPIGVLPVWYMLSSGMPGAPSASVFPGSMPLRFRYLLQEVPLSVSFKKSWESPSHSLTPFLSASLPVL